MKQRRTSEPADPKGGRSRPAARLRRTAWILTAVVAVGIGAVALAAAPSGAPVEAQPPAQAQENPPGVQPPVQKWMKDRDDPQIELNNSLVAIVQQKIAKPRDAQVACRRLDRATRALSETDAAPDPQVDLLMRAGLAKFEQGAAACLAGDIATAERLVAEGLAERAAADEPLIDVLEGE